MASPKASSDDFDDTQTLYAPHLEHKTQAQAGMLTLYLMNCILIHSPGETDGGSSSEPSEIEKADKEMFERWKDEADSALVFVCVGSTILCTITL
jgi:hypothetical protein